MRKGKKFISAALGFALVFQSFAGIGPVAVAATGDVDINSTFTDANFRSYVSSNFDTNKDGTLSEKEIDAVTSLNVSISTYSKKISSLAGVDVFTSLEYLDCSGQAIGSLDVADLENLKSINASSDQLTTFTLPKKAEQLASVNLSYNQITDITFQTTYAALKELNVYGNQLTSIDLSKLPALVRLNVGYNVLSALDLSKNTNLEFLHCQNMTKLHTLDISSNSVDHTKLAYVDCSYMLSGGEGGINELDITGDTGLKTLIADDNAISVLNMDGATSLQILSVAGNKIKSIDVSKESSLETLNLSNNSIQSVDVSKNAVLKYLNLGAMLLSTIDVTKNPLLEKLDLNSNQLMDIDVSKNTALTELDLSDNRLQKIDVKNNTGLTTLKLDNNALVAIDVSSCPGLLEGEFSCTNNSRHISLSEPNYIFNMANLVADGYQSEYSGVDRKDDTIGYACIRTTDQNGNNLIKNATLQGYTLYTDVTNEKTQNVEYSYYIGLGKQTAKFKLIVDNPLSLIVWYTSNGSIVNSGNAELSLRVGDTTTLVAKDKKENEYSKDIISWSSSDPKVFKVDNDGTLTCVGAGTATLYVNINNKARAYMTISCHKPVTKVVLKDKQNVEYNDGDTIDLVAGSWVGDDLKTKTLTATCYTDEGVADKEYSGVTYKVTTTADKDSASNYKVATCTNAGVLTAKGAGTVYLHCISKDSGVDTVLKVNVSQMGEGVTLSEQKTTMFTGVSKTFTATVTPDTATNKELVWSSSDETVAQVDQNGKVTAISEGTATIFCKLKANQGIYARAEITVYTSANGVTLNHTEYTLIKGATAEKRRVTLVAKIQAEDTSLFKPKYSSSNPEIATVGTTTGIVSAVAPGEAIITCTIADGISTECKITVIQRVTGIQIVREGTVMNSGEKMKVTANVMPADASNPDVEWSSSDENIAAIAADGTITALKQGKVIIYCKALDGSGKQSQFNLTINELAKDITVDQTNVVAYIDKDTVVKTKVTPDTATKKTLSWSSDDTSIATVSGGTMTVDGISYTIGRIRGVAPGTTTIRCTTQDGSNIEKEIKVTVVQQITNITLDKTAVEINAGEKASIAASVLPANAGNKKVVWSSSDEKIAKVDQKGMITAVGRGTAVITCSAADGMGAKTTCRVTVKQRVTSIKLDATTMKLFVGNKQSLTQTVLPENANMATVEWSSSNAKVAQVTSYGQVTAMAAGKAVITCKAKDGSGVFATCSVTVVNPVQSIKLNQTQRTILKGKKYTLKAKVGPKNATSKAVTWKSSDKKIATVSSKGVVTAKKAGRVTITCTAKDGSNVYATCSVTVANPVKTIKLNKKKVTIKKKGTYLLKATVGPKSAGNKTVKWTSSNKKVATVSASGLVTAKKKGKVTITVKAKDGSKKTAKCIVTVK